MMLHVFIYIDAYGVYTRVSSHYEWITKQLRKELEIPTVKPPKPTKVTSTTKKPAAEPEPW